MVEGLSVPQDCSAEKREQEPLSSDLLDRLLEVRMTRRDFLKLTGLVGAMVFGGERLLRAVEWLKDSGNDQKTREALREIDLLGGREIISESTSAIIEANRPEMERVAETYSIPASALEQIAVGEIGPEYQRGILGSGKASEQKLKMAINYVRTLAGDQGDFTPEGRHLGLSLGWLNQKPGLFTQAVIENIKDEVLRGEMLEGFDERQGHVKDEVLAEAVTFSLPTSLELAAAYLELWWSPMSRCEALRDSSEEEKIALLVGTCGPYAPQFRDRLRKLLGEESPNLE